MKKNTLFGEIFIIVQALCYLDPENSSLMALVGRHITIEGDGAGVVSTEPSTVGGAGGLGGVGAVGAGAGA